MSLDNRYKFSIIMAIYNSEEYVEESILSVINQNIGFLNNVQLILIDDGSTDFSAAICKKYRDKYKNNIIYVHKKNGGVSSARNIGLKFVEGKYINFLDSDDKLNVDVLSKVYDYFEAVYDYTDIVSIPVYYFEGKSGQHILNYKYDSTRIIDLDNEYTNIQLFINSSFIKSEHKNNIKFDEKMKYAEDAEVINKILLEKRKLGVYKDTVYWYRFRNNNSSAVQVGNDKKEWYLDYIKYFSLKMFNYCLKSTQEIPKFIQYTVLYDLQWRINNIKLAREVLNSKEFEEFASILINILQRVEVTIILKQKNIKIHRKLLLLLIKENNSSFNKFLINMI